MLILYMFLFMTHLNSSRSSVLEAYAMESLVEIDGVLPGHHLGHGAGLLSADHSGHVYKDLKQVKKAHS